MRCENRRRHDHARHRLRHEVRGLRALERHDAGQDVDLAQQVALVQRLQPLHEVVVSKMGCVWMNCAPALIFFSARMASYLGGAPKGEAAAPRNHWGRCLISRPSRYLPSSRMRRSIHSTCTASMSDWSGLPMGEGPKQCVVAAQTEDVANAQPGSAHGVRLERDPAAIPRLKLHHRLQPQVQAELAGGQAAHARRGRGVVGEVGGASPCPCSMLRLLLQQLGRRGQRRRDLSRDDKGAGAQVGLQPRNGLLIGGRVILRIALPPVGLAQIVEELVPLVRGTSRGR